MKLTAKEIMRYGAETEREEELIKALSACIDRIEHLGGELSVESGNYYCYLFEDEE